MRSFLMAIILGLSCSAMAEISKDVNEVLEECKSTREYVTTLEFLRKHKEFAVPELEAQKVARKVVEGCSEAGKRFVKVTNLLTRVGISTRQAIQTAIKFAHSTDERTNSFIHIFKRAYIKKYLDLDIQSSMKMALDLSLDFKASERRAQDDFDTLVHFCTSDKELDLPLPICAKMAARVTKSGEKFEKKISESYIELFRFLKSKRGPAITTGQAMKIAEKTVKYGPIAALNFIDAFKYASKKDGLGFDNSKAVSFAKLMAKESLKAKTNK